MQESWVPSLGWEDHLEKGYGYPLQYSGLENSMDYKSGTRPSYFHFHFLVFPCGSAGKVSVCNVGDLGLILGLERSPGEGKGYLFQYSGLENSMCPCGHKESVTTE